MAAPEPVPNASCSPDGSTLAYQLGGLGSGGLWSLDLSGGRPIRLTDGQGMHPVWSPDGRSIAFESTRSGNADIWLLPRSGGTPTRLTGDPAPDWDPVWSPDGRWIAFTSARDSAAVWAVSASGDSLIRVSQDGGSRPAWSPDARRIAYQTKSEDGNWDLYVVDLHKPGAAQLTQGGGADLDPAWSPDGRRIAYRSIRRDGADVFLVAADGGAPVRLTSNAGADAGPVWSPDGRRIAFISYSAWNSIVVVPVNGGRPATVLGGLTRPSSLSWHPRGERLFICAGSSDLWAAPVAGGPARPLTQDIYEDRKPDVSPDGVRIVFESNRHGNPGLWFLATEGGLPRPFLAGDSINAHPRFSVDGSRIAFASRRDGQTQIWTAAADGSDQRQLTSAGGLKGRPAWFRDNAQIIYESDIGGEWAIWAFNPGRQGPIPVIKMPSMRPAWSPDGWWVAYQSERHENQDIYLTQMKTGQEIHLTRHEAREGDPAWSRDSRWMSFVSDRAGSDDIYTMALSGDATERALTSGPEDDIEPAWFPGGDRIVFVRIFPQSVWSVPAP